MPAIGMFMPMPVVGICIGMFIIGIFMAVFILSPPRRFSGGFALMGDVKSWIPLYSAVIERQVYVFQRQSLLLRISLRYMERPLPSFWTSARLLPRAFSA